MPHGGGRKGLRGYGDLKGRNRAGRGAKADEPEGERVQRCDAAANGVDCSVPHWAGNWVIAAVGKSVCYRLWMLKSRRMVVRSAGDCIHTACRCGGARMCCPRTRVSMMIIGAPQSGQTKVGLMDLVDG